MKITKEDKIKIISEKIGIKITDHNGFQVDAVSSTKLATFLLEELLEKESGE